VLNNVTDVLSVVLSGTLGRSGRKRARRASSFLTGHRGFLGGSALMAAAGVAWGIYDTIKNQQVQGVQGAQGVQGVQGFPPPIPPGATTAAGAASDTVLDPVARVIQLAISAAKADGSLTDDERAMIMARAREAGLESIVEAELSKTHQLADIVRGVTDPAIKNELYVLAFTIVRADETVSGAERIYLAQLAHQLGLDSAAAQQLETDTAAKIDSQPE
jgi:uncharacterized membrane protein YebE (DUF533 family)